MIEKKINDLEQDIKDLKVAQAVSGSLVKVYFAEKNTESRRTFSEKTGYMVNVTVTFVPTGDGIVFLSGWLEEWLEGQEGTDNVYELDKSKEANGRIIATAKLASGTTLYSKTPVANVHAVAYGTVPGELFIDLNIEPT